MAGLLMFCVCYRVSLHTHPFILSPCSDSLLYDSPLPFLITLLVALPPHRL